MRRGAGISFGPFIGRVVRLAFAREREPGSRSYGLGRRMDDVQLASLHLPYRFQQFGTDVARRVA